MNRIDHYTIDHHTITRWSLHHMAFVAMNRGLFPHLIINHFEYLFFLLVSLQFSSLLTLPLNFLYFNSSFSLVQFHFMFASFFFLFFVVFRSIHNEYTLKTRNPLDPCAWDRAKGIQKNNAHTNTFISS